MFLRENCKVNQTLQDSNIETHHFWSLGLATTHKTTASIMHWQSLHAGISYSHSHLCTNVTAKMLQLFFLSKNYWNLNYFGVYKSSSLLIHTTAVTFASGSYLKELHTSTLCHSKLYITWYLNFVFYSGTSRNIFFLSQIFIYKCFIVYRWASVIFNHENKSKNYIYTKIKQYYIYIDIHQG